MVRDVDVFEPTRCRREVVAFSWLHLPRFVCATGQAPSVIRPELKDVCLHSLQFLFAAFLFSTVVSKPGHEGGFAENYTLWSCCQSASVRDSEDEAAAGRLEAVHDPQFRSLSASLKCFLYFVPVILFSCELYHDTSVQSCQQRHSVAQRFLTHCGCSHKRGCCNVTVAEHNIHRCSTLQEQLCRRNKVQDDHHRLSFQPR